MELLSVNGLCKHYDSFALRNVSFSLEEGYIMGFIGRNGAGKTTTLKSILNLVHPDAGEIRILGQPFAGNETACKQNLGVAFGGADYYPKRRLRDIAAVTRRFYPKWDDQAYLDYLKRFELDDAKRVEQLSAGMKVKFSLALALSHDARLLLLDEPTSGLDPISRDDLVELFQSLIETGERSILFSTHITSDLEKCADYITYIRDGQILASQEKDSLLEEYRLVKGPLALLAQADKTCLIGTKEHSFGFSALAKTADTARFPGAEISHATLEELMIYLDKEE
ncbi:MAG: ABC transporter ATP-binding protein [Eubacteriales bacterium]|nr:ABC transporter ATP-binding protein [Eubacteriales bacterium]